MEPTVEALLGLAFDKEDIKPQHKENILAYLKVLHIRDQATYEHCVRVGLLAETIAFVANRPGITPKMMLWAGLLHDIGKALIAPEVLKKTSNFSKEDVAAMEPHVKYGWDLLQDVHDYTAHIIVRHHQFGPKPYPAVLPPLPLHLQSKADLIMAAARLLSLADYYDAMMHRRNDKWGNLPMESQQKREKYHADNSDEAALIATLEELGVFSFS